MSATSQIPFFATAAAPPGTIALDPLRVWKALADPLRWRIVNLLAAGQAMSGTQIAIAFGKHPDTVNKQLRVLRDAGILLVQPGSDRRFCTYQISSAVRATPGVLDYGFFTLRLPNAKPDPAKD